MKNVTSLRQKHHYICKPYRSFKNCSNDDFVNVVMSARRFLEHIYALSHKPW